METKQLTQEELQEIKSLKDNFNNAFANLGVLVTRIKELKAEKKRNTGYIGELKQVEEQLYQSLKDKYGEGTVDLTTGEFKSQN